MNENELWMIRKMSRHLNMPSDLCLLLECFVRNGCPALGVLNGVIEYAKIKQTASDIEQLKEMVKDIPGIKFEFDGGAEE